MLPVQVPLPEVVLLNPNIQNLELRERQLSHFERTCEILNRFYFYVDGSEMGNGKGVIVIAHSIIRKLPIIYFGPKTGLQNFMNEVAKYGASVWNLTETGGILTYNALRSIKGIQPKHGLLTRDDSGETVKFYATSLFARIVKSGVLVIFDECQKLKNTSDQYHAAKALMRQIYAGGSNSRAAFLSGTTMDKPDQAINFMRLVGFINQRNLYSKIRGQIRLEGVEELQDWARRINAEETEKFMLANPFRSTRQGSTDYVFQMYIEVIKPGIMSIMPSQQLDKNIKNGYYKLEPEDEKLYCQAIANFAHVTQYNAATNTINRTKDNMGAITTAQINLQKAKMKAMSRKARETLMNNPNCKVLLYADYYDVINYLLVALADYNPLELTGKISEDQRNDNMNHFQEPNTNYRLIIGNPVVGGLCINLHDVTGNFPRYSFIMPGYRINELHQATGRTARDGLIGTATIRFFYGLSGSRENSILTALSRKGEIMQKVHSEQGARFPNEYEDEREEI
jgi:hypothetical protein